MTDESAIATIQNSKPGDGASVGACVVVVGSSLVEVVPVSLVVGVELVSLVVGVELVSLVVSDVEVVCVGDDW